MDGQFRNTDDIFRTSFRQIWQQVKGKKKFSILVIVLVFNTTFNNISVIFWLQHFGQ